MALQKFHDSLTLGGIWRTSIIFSVIGNAVADKAKELEHISQDQLLIRNSNHKG